MRSIEDASGQRCVDLMRGTDGWAFVECRRDPEDAHGWRRLTRPVGGFRTEDGARDAALDAVGWLDRDGRA